MLERVGSFVFSTEHWVGASHRRHPARHLLDAYRRPASPTPYEVLPRNLHEKLVGGSSPGLTWPWVNQLSHIGPGDPEVRNKLQARSILCYFLQLPGNAFSLEIFL